MGIILQNFPRCTNVGEIWRLHTRAKLRSTLGAKVLKRSLGWRRADVQRRVLRTHQWGHHPFAGWGDDNPQVGLAAAHPHVPSRGRWRLGGHDLAQAVAAGRAEEGRRAPGVDIAVPCRGAQKHKHITKTMDCD